jgi:hypothetical protein
VKLGLAILPVIMTALAPPARAGEESADPVIRAMIEAHGGMDAWKNAPTVSFRDRFERPGVAEAGETVVTVEQSSRRAYLDVPDTDQSMAWDGTKAWGVNWAQPAPPRFFALLNYYFLNLPWLTQDPGVKLGVPGTGSIPFDETEYITVRMTFEAGVGDTPDDYYVLFIEPDGHRLRACEYVVTYKALLPPCVAHTPPHVLVYDEYETVDGLLVPTRYTIYDGNQVYFKCVIDDWSFTKPFDESRMVMPEGAVEDTSEP